MTLHIGDCPMTNTDPAERTGCVCDRAQDPDEPRDYVEAAAGIRVWWCPECDLYDRKASRPVCGSCGEEMVSGDGNVVRGRPEDSDEYAALVDLARHLARVPTDAECDAETRRMRNR
jgi:hypothetical protein